MKKSINKKGFTMIELVVVITIIGILGAIGIVTYVVQIKNSKDTDRVSAVNSIYNSIITDFTSGYRPVSLSHLKSISNYPTDPGNNLGYQYNLTTNTASEDPRLGGKSFIVCTNQPLEKFQDDEGNLDVNKLKEIGVKKSNFLFNKGTYQDGPKDTKVDISYLDTMGHYCAGQTTSFKALISGGTSPTAISYATEDCSPKTLTSTNTGDNKGKACKIIFNEKTENMASGESPTPGTPPKIN